MSQLYYKVILPKLTSQELLIADVELASVILGYGGMKLVSFIPASDFRGPVAKVLKHYTKNSDNELVLYFRVPNLKFNMISKEANQGYFILQTTERSYLQSVTSEPLVLEPGSCYSSTDLIENLNAKKLKLLNDYSAEKVFTVNFTPRNTIFDPLGNGPRRA